MKTSKYAVKFFCLVGSLCFLSGCETLTKTFNAMNDAARQQQQQNEEAGTKAKIDIYPNEMSEINTRKGRALNTVEVNKTLILVFVPQVVGAHNPSWRIQYGENVCAISQTTVPARSGRYAALAVTGLAKRGYCDIQITDSGMPGWALSYRVMMEK